MQTEQEEVRRDQMLQQIGCEDRLEAAAQVWQPIFDVCERHVEAKRLTKLDVPLHSINPGAARTEVHQMLAVGTADVQHGLLVQIVRLTDVADRASWHEEVA